MTTTPHYDLSTLTAAVSETGDLCRKPCTEPRLNENIHFAAFGMDACPGCGGTGKVWDEAHSIVQALWKECWCPKRVWHQESQEGGSWWNKPCNPKCNMLHDTRCVCEGTGYVPRSRPEAALGLLEAVRREGWHIAVSQWSVALNKGNVHKASGTMNRSTDWADDLAAAIEGNLRGEKRP